MRPASGQGAGGGSFQSLVSEGMAFHDKADKKKSSDPSAAIALFRQAITKYIDAEQALPDGQDSQELKFNMGTAFSSLAGLVKESETRNSKEQAKEFYEQACVHYAAVLEIQPHQESINNWGAALTSMADLVGKEEALALLKQGSEKLEQAITMNPKDFEAATNLGDSFAYIARLLSQDAATGQIFCGEEAEAHFVRAYETYTWALTIMEYDYDKVNCLCNWSNELSNHAEIRHRMGDLASASSLYQQAAGKLEEVCQKQPFDCDGWVALAEAQKSVAETTPALEEVALQAASTSYQAALKIRADHSDSIVGLAENQLDIARNKLKVNDSDQEAVALLTQAGEMYFRWLSFNETDSVGLYNMACICALLNRQDECSQYLVRSIRAEQAAGSDMNQWAQSTAEDVDFKGVVKEEWFQNLLRMATTPVF